MDSTQNSTTQSSTPAKKGNRTLLIVLGVILLLCLCFSAIGAAIYFFSINALNDAANIIENTPVNPTPNNNNNNDANPDNDAPTDNDTDTGSDTGTLGSDIPIYPGALSFGDIVVEGDTTTAIYTVEATKEELREFYETQLPQYGWDIEETVDVVALVMTAEKGSRELSIAITANIGESMGTLVISVTDLP